jgi:hypothetical protein
MLILPILTAFNQGLLDYINHLFSRLKVYLYDGYINYLSINKIEHIYETYRGGCLGVICSGNEELKQSILWYMDKMSGKSIGTNILSIHKGVDKYDDIIKNKMENKILLMPNYIKIDDIDFYYKYFTSIDANMQRTIETITIISRKTNDELNKYLKDIYDKYIMFANQPKSELYLYIYINI